MDVNNKEILLTQEGYDKIENELETLKTVTRKEVAGRIKEAISFGDISENAEYDEAKNEQAKVEERILKLENMLRKAKIIKEEEVDEDLVTVGSIVTVFDYEFDERAEYTIVGSAEADPYENKISNESPVGRALIGRRKDEEIDVQVPDGIARFKIVEIRR